MPNEVRIINVGKVDGNDRAIIIEMTEPLSEDQMQQLGEFIQRLLSIMHDVPTVHGLNEVMEDVRAIKFDGR